MGKFFFLLLQTNYKLTNVQINQTIIGKPITNENLLKLYFNQNDHGARRPPASDPKERAIAHTFS